MDYMTVHKSTSVYEVMRLCFIKYMLRMTKDCSLLTEYRFDADKYHDQNGREPL